jgi:hypothetical protein
MFDTAYVSKTLPLGPAEAAGIADLWHWGLDEISVGSRFVRAVDRLWLGGELCAVSPDPSAIRHTPGILWVWGWPVRIEFEVAAWSATATTVAIRPVGRTPVTSTGRYARAAYRAVERVTQSLTLTQEHTVARSASFRSVRDVLLDRKFQWPARPGREAVAFASTPPAGSPVVEAEGRFVQARSS